MSRASTVATGPSCVGRFAPPMQYTVLPTVATTSPCRAVGIGGSEIHFPRALTLRLRLTRSGGSSIVAGWSPAGLSARVAREAAATTQADGTIWIFGGLGSDGSVSGRHDRCGGGRSGVREAG
jgi:hypothetical protein